MIRQQERPAGGVWMITFTDLVALLLTFFVLLFSMMRLEEETWRPVGDSIAQRLDRSLLSAPLLPDRLLSMRRESEPEAADLDYLAALLRGLLLEQPALGRVEIGRFEDRILLSLPSALLFDDASATPRPEARSALAALANLLANIGNAITVAGQADPRPLRREGLSNWELSLARAAAVADLLQAGGYRKPILLTGHAATRFAEIAPSLPYRERLALARRSDIVIWATAERAR